MGIKFIGDRTKIVSKDTSIIKKNTLFKSRDLSQIIFTIPEISGNKLLSVSGGRLKYYANQNGSWNKISIANNYKILTGHNPLDMAVYNNGTRAIILNSNGTDSNSNASIIDLVNETILGTVEIPYVPQSVKVSSDGTKAIVTGVGLQTVYSSGGYATTNENVGIINLTTLSTTFLKCGQGTPGNLTADSDGFAYVTNYLGYSNYGIAKINLSTNGISQIVSTGSNNVGPFKLTPNKLKIINTSIQNGLRTIQISSNNTSGNTVVLNSSIPCLGNIAVTSDNSKAFVIPSWTGTNIVVLNLINDTVSGTITYTNAASDVAITPNNAKAIVSAVGTTTFINVSNNSIINTIPIGGTSIKVIDNNTALILGGQGFYVINLNDYTYTSKTVSKTSCTVRAMEIQGNTAWALLSNNSISKISMEDYSYVEYGRYLGENRQYPSIIRVSPDQKFAAITSPAPQVINLLDNSQNPIPVYSNVGSPTDMRYSPDSRFLFIKNGTTYYTITNPSTCTTLKNIGSYPGLTNVVFTPNSSKAILASSNGNAIIVNLNDQGFSETIVPCGTNPKSVAISPDGMMAAVANFGSNNVTLINLGNNSTSTISCGTGPSGIEFTPSGTKILVSNQTSNNVTLINLSNNNSTSNISSGTTPSKILITPDGAKAFIMGGTCAILNLVTNQLIRTFTIPAYARDCEMSIDGTKVILWFSQGTAEGIINSVEFDMVNNSSSFNRISTGTLTPDDAVITSNGLRTVYVSRDNANGIVVVDNTNSTTTTYTGTGKKIVVAPNGSKAIIVNNAAGTGVTVLNNLQSGTISTSSIATGAYPIDAVITPDSSRAVVINYSSNTARVITLSDNGTFSAISCGAGPETIKISPTGSKAITLNYGSQSATIINVTSNPPTSTNINCGFIPAGVSFSPDGLRAIITSQGTGSPPFTNKVIVVNLTNNSFQTLTTAGSVSGSNTSIFTSNTTAALLISGANLMLDLSNNQISTWNIDTKLISIENVLLSPDGTKLVLSSKQYGNISVINLADNSVKLYKSNTDVDKQFIPGSNKLVGLRGNGNYLEIFDLDTSMVSVIPAGLGNFISGAKLNINSNGKFAACGYGSNESNKNIIFGDFSGFSQGTYVSTLF